MDCRIISDKKKKAISPISALYCIYNTVISNVLSISINSTLYYLIKYFILCTKY